MPRPRERVCMQDGLKLDMNRLARKDFVKFGGDIGVRGNLVEALVLGRNSQRDDQRRYDRRAGGLTRYSS
jgi:hypothetical protein